MSTPTTFFSTIDTTFLPPFSYGEESQLVMENNKIHPDKPNFIPTDKDLSFDIQNCKTILYLHMTSILQSLEKYFPEVFTKGFNHPSYEPYRFLKKGVIFLLDQILSEEKMKDLSFRTSLLDIIKKRMEGKFKESFITHYPSLQKFIDYELPSHDPLLTQRELDYLLKG